MKELVLNVEPEPLTSAILSEGCDTEQTEERKFSDLEPKVEHPDISASAISDTLPEYKCKHHGVDSGGTDYYGTSNPPQECDWNYSYCPNCGEKL